MGDIMIDKVWGKVGFDVGNGNNLNCDLDDVCCVDWGIVWFGDVFNEIFWLIKLIVNCWYVIIYY